MGDGIQSSLDVRHVAYFSHFIPVFFPSFRFYRIIGVYTFSLTDSRRGTGHGVSVADREYPLGFPFLFLVLVLLIY